MGIQLFDEASVYNQLTRFVTGTGTAITGVTDSVQQPRRINNLLVTNTDTIAHVVSLYYVSGGVSYLLGSVSVAAGAGTLGTPSVDVLAAILPAAVSGIPLQPGQVLSLALTVAMVATFNLDVVALGGIV